MLYIEIYRCYTDLDGLLVGNLVFEQSLLQGAEGERLPQPHHHQVNIAGENIWNIKKIY